MWLITPTSSELRSLESDPLQANRCDGEMTLGVPHASHHLSQAVCGLRSLEPDTLTGFPPTSTLHLALGWQLGRGKQST